MRGGGHTKRWKRVAMKRKGAAAGPHPSPASPLGIPRSPLKTGATPEIATARTSQTRPRAGRTRKESRSAFATAIHVCGTIPHAFFGWPAAFLVGALRRMSRSALFPRAGFHKLLALALAMPTTTELPGAFKENHPADVRKRQRGGRVRAPSRARVAMSMVRKAAPLSLTSRTVGHTSLQ